MIFRSPSPTHRSFGAAVAALGIAALVAACAHTPPAAEPVAPTSTPETTSAQLPAPTSEKVVIGGIGLDESIVAACKLNLDNVDRAPKFAFDDDALPASERAALGDVATCFTTGPLAGRALDLVGHTDPRGEQEYNMALGARRADSVAQYLRTLGVADAQLALSSRGKLDAHGTDEDGWARDRRVDLELR